MLREPVRVNHDVPPPRPKREPVLRLIESPAAATPPSEPSDLTPESLESDDVRRAATTEALLDQIAQEQDPWTYLNAIEDRDVPPELRQPFYQTFIALTATRPLAEQDALINAGMRIFRYRAETARRDVRDATEQAASSPAVVPSLIADDFIAEMIHVHGASPNVKYLVWRIGAAGQEQVEIVDSIAVGAIRYVPPQMPSLVGKSLKLPTGIEDSPDTATLLAEIRDFIARFVQLDGPGTADLVSFYILYSWVADRISVAPYLHVVGDYGAGKTRLLDVLGHLTRRGLMAAGALTAPVLFRVLNHCGATLLVDEADFDPRDPAWRDILRIFRTGSTQGAQVLRIDMDAGGEVKGYDAFGPKVLATRKSLGDAALASRCFDVTMYPGSVEEHIPLILPPEFFTGAQRLCNRLLGWRLRHVRRVLVDPHWRFDGLEPRVNQAALALLAASDDATVRNLLLARLREKSAGIRQQRAESLEAIVVEALVQRSPAHKATAGLRRIPLKEIREQIQVQTEDRDLPDFNLVKETITGPLGLKLERRGGKTRVLVPEMKLRSLAGRYDVLIPQIESVAGAFRSPTSPTPRVRTPVH